MQLLCHPLTDACTHPHTKKSFVCHPKTFIWNNHADKLGMSTAAIQEKKIKFSCVGTLKTVGMTKITCLYK